MTAHYDGDRQYTLTPLFDCGDVVRCCIFVVYLSSSICLSDERHLLPVWSVLAEMEKVASWCMTAAGAHTRSPWDVWSNEAAPIYIWTAALITLPCLWYFLSRCHGLWRYHRCFLHSRTFRLTLSWHTCCSLLNYGCFKMATRMEILCQRWNYVFHQIWHHHNTTG